MTKLLQIQEYDYLVREGQVKGRLLPKDHVVEAHVFDELLEFAKNQTKVYMMPFHQKNQKKNPKILEVSDDERWGEKIRVNNFVGMIQLKSGDQIEIMPKIAFHSEEGSFEKSKKIFLKMIQCFPGLECVSSGIGNLDAGELPLYEIFISVYLDEVKRLVKHGIKYDYKSVKENLNCFKGKLDVCQHMKKNLCHKERFFVEHDEFHPDRVENQLIKTTLLYLKKKTVWSKNARLIQQLLSYFEHVSVSTRWKEDFAKIDRSRNMKEYETILNWSRLFLSHRSFSAFSGKHDNYAILFPMEIVYENYVARYMKKYWSKENIEVSIQDQGNNVFHRVLEEPRGNKKAKTMAVFRIRPDIVCKKESSIVIMDTKWKKIKKDQNDLGITREDIYQMYTYCGRYCSKEVWLLYPYDWGCPEEPVIFYEDGGNEIRLGAYFIDLEHMDQSMERLKQLVWNTNRLHQSEIFD